LEEREKACCVCFSLARRALRLARARSISSSSSSSGIRASARLAGSSTGAAASSTARLRRATRGASSPAAAARTTATQRELLRAARTPLAANGFCTQTVCILHGAHGSGKRQAASQPFVSGARLNNAMRA
jgi:hypothetical protein